ncbi:hypothetical protein YS28_004560 [Salmonella enterica subsp. enterica]|nr:hypothetical protein [Salmonella enterica subsp. enterica serovar Typhi]EDW6383875.1 hypothetical protein [Salmonella enterica subsp. enterica]
MSKHIKSQVTPSHIEENIYKHDLICLYKIMQEGLIIMAFCDYCNRGIGPENRYEFIYHKAGVFGTHDYCKEKMLIRLENLEKEKSLGKKDLRDE